MRASFGLTGSCLLALTLALPACASRAVAPATMVSDVQRQMAKTRALSSRVVPSSGGLSVTVESWDPRLRAALEGLALHPTADQHRRVGEEYRRLGVLDAAHRHLTDAVRLDPMDAGAHDGLARIWRDWGFPHLGIEDGRRAVGLAPDSPVAANTLGTLYAAAGGLGQAHQWYAKALTLAPDAPYALNNYCYSAIRLGRSYAVLMCERAVSVQPDSMPVHNNLGLAYAAAGDLERARGQFARAGEAEARYNLGIVYLAQGQVEQAAAAFRGALDARPTFRLAAARARQAEAMLDSKRDRNDDGN